MSKFRNARNARAQARAEEQPVEPKTQKKPDYEPPPRAVPESTIIEIEHKAENGAVYRARVKYTVPSMADQIEISRMQAVLIGRIPEGSLMTGNGATLAAQLAYLMITLDETTLPSWWNPDESRDWSPYVAIWGKAVLHETLYFRGGEGEAALPSGDGGGADEPDAGDGEDDADDGVEPPLQSPAERSEVLVPHRSRAR